MIPTMRPAAFVDQLEAHGQRLGDVLAAVGLDDPVPSCPGWVVRDLLQHTGGIHRWAASFVGERRTEPIDADLIDLVGGAWPSDLDLLGWFRAGHVALVDALRSAPEDLVCWTFLVAPSPLAMWSRRQAHETAIHRVDAELAAGVQPARFDSQFAADGIDELLVAFMNRPGRGPRSDRPVTIEVHDTDRDRSWWVSFDDQACVTTRSGGSAEARLAGPADALYRVLWNRLPADEVSVEGDRSLIDLWRDTAHVRWS